ncbi:MAG TPA: Spi family protease inhibitor, partial [Bacteroidales bacterium]|nr:Spi family protease inhibitor [Bacteroidales bacterium]
MKNFLLSLLLLVVNIFQGIGQSADFSVKPEEAIQVAVNIFFERFPDQIFNRENPEVIIIERRDFPVFYAVNFEHGFVLVSAFKNVWPVLAYSCEGKFSKPCDEQNV